MSERNKKQIKKTDNTFDKRKKTSANKSSGSYDKKSSGSYDKSSSSSYDKKSSSSYDKSSSGSYDKTKRPKSSFSKGPIKNKPANKQETQKESKQEGVRLNKYIANGGICSRREADTFIATGVVSINGKVVTELGVRVLDGDEVRFNGERIKPEQKVYILLNKPKDYVTTLDDPEGRKIVMDLIKGACDQRVYPVGRLDRNTTGLLLLTNDGELTKKLTHPSYKKKKIYHVEIDNPISPEQLQMMKDGIELEDGAISVDSVSYVNNNPVEIGIELHSGRNRIVRRIMEHFGLNVKRLDRVYFAGLTKLNLPRGKWRFLTEKEIITLKTGMYE